MTDYSELEEKLGYVFKNKKLLELALTHSSYSNEHKLGRDNERLEFVGDSVLGFVTAEYLFGKMSDLPEGELTKLRSRLVCEDSLYGFAQLISLGSFIMLGRGELATGGADRPSVLSDAFEAVIAAVFFDGGIEQAKRFVLRFIVPAADERSRVKDYKSALQEEIQKNRDNALSYSEIGESGPPHSRVFEFAVCLNSQEIGRGEGRTKKEAEQMAARAALRSLGKL